MRISKRVIKPVNNDGNNLIKVLINIWLKLNFKRKIIYDINYTCNEGKVSLDWFVTRMTRTLMVTDYVRESCDVRRGFWPLWHLPVTFMNTARVKGIIKFLFVSIKLDIRFKN